MMRHPTSVDAAAGGAASAGLRADAHVVVSDGAYVEELLEELRQVGCRATKVARRIIAVELPHPREEDPQLLELSFFLGAWQAFHAHVRLSLAPGAEGG